jgi:hypothetical protein
MTGTVETQPSSTVTLRWLQLRAIAHSVSSPSVTNVMHGEYAPNWPSIFAGSCRFSNFDATSVRLIQPPAHAQLRALREAG